MTLDSTMIPILVGLFVFYLIFLIFLLRWVWNTVIADIFDLRKITLWESAKLVLLFCFLFSGIKASF